MFSGMPVIFFSVVKIVFHLVLCSYASFVYMYVDTAVRTRCPENIHPECQGKHPYRNNMYQSPDIGSTPHHCLRHWSDVKPMTSVHTLLSGGAGDPDGGLQRAQMSINFERNRSPAHARLALRINGGHARIAADSCWLCCRWWDVSLVSH